MEDSVEKTSEQPVSKPAESVEIVHHMGGDKLTKRIRGEGGKFVRQPKTMPKSEDMTRYLRNVLNRAEANEDGTITKGSKSRISKAFNNVLKNAEMPAEQPMRDKLGNQLFNKNGSPIMIVDPKIMMASAQNLKEAMLISYGTPKKSDEELNAMKTQTVKVVILQHPELMDKTVYKEKPRPKLEPAFAEVLDVKTNE